LGYPEDGATVPAEAQKAALDASGMVSYHPGREKLIAVATGRL
jgi:hypothetical protein